MNLQELTISKKRRLVITRAFDFSRDCCEDKKEKTGLIKREERAFRPSVGGRQPETAAYLFGFAG
jgi:hypothetical protein